MNEEIIIDITITHIHPCRSRISGLCIFRELVIQGCTTLTLEYYLMISDGKSRTKRKATREEKGEADRDGRAGSRPRAVEC